MYKWMSVVLLLCLIGCDNKSVEERDFSHDADIDAFSVLGVNMGDSYGETKILLSRQVGRASVDRVILIKDHKVGPTTFGEIKFYFSSFESATSLYKIELITRLGQKDAEFFAYFWHKEFSDKYGFQGGVSYNDKDDISCFNNYGGMTTNIHISITKLSQPLSSDYECCIIYEDYAMEGKPFNNMSDADYENYFDSISRNKYVFTEW